ncbi:MAG TPA: protein kinase [Dictyobacter sp.]|jgi:serine/threonine protein kinase|nr:protein kinase [Dictyobacter sp.]
MIQKVIGQGGMGAVYLAKDIKGQGRLCAIKEMSLSMVPPDEQPQAIQNFKIEAKILWGLDHPNLPALIGFFSQNQRYYLVMEYINGWTLEELLERNRAPFPERRALNWARQLCDVLTYLHSQKPPIIFRDMKPGNIMLTREGQIKLIDFGIARFFRPMHAQDTQILGTPGYAPPEQYGTSQTDERSDIYALGMTLFHLLTNTLSEHGFGLEYVHDNYPRISPMVARALEKATRIKPDERYEDVVAFQRALFGVGSFVFESGEIAATPEELAELCVNYPEEAADYLRDGEIEAWFQDLGENKLAELSHYLLKTEPDPLEAIQELVNEVLGQQEQRKDKNLGFVVPASHGGTATQAHNPVRYHLSSTRLTSDVHEMDEELIEADALYSSPQTVPVQVRPGTLDFGAVSPGISSPLTVSIASDVQGYKVSGTIRTEEPWIQLSQRKFDGIITDIGVRINSLRLQKNRHYSGKIIITPDDKAQRELVVKVAADIQASELRNRRHPGRTHGADLDVYDDDDELDNLVIKPDDVQRQYDSQGLHVTVQDEDLSEEDLKYGQLYEDGHFERKWDPWILSITQRKWQLLILSLCSSFMSSSLVYTLLSSSNPPPISPSPQFILVLVGMVPASTLGALIVSWDRMKRQQESLDRTVTSLVSSMLSLTLIEGCWQLIFGGKFGSLQLSVMLAVTAVGAAVGILRKPSDWILSRIRRLSYLLGTEHWLLIALAVVLGGGLGYFLTMGFVVGSFTTFGILLGIGIAIALVWRADDWQSKARRRQKV